VDTPARLLRLLALLSSRASWRADELVERLGVTERTIRRDIHRLRDLGYPVDAVTGPYGGYSLGAGGRLPPLLLDDEEAVAVAIALHAVAQRDGLAEAALRALTKLAQVLPVPLRERVAAFGSVAVGVGWPRDRFADAGGVAGTGEPEGIGVLMSLAVVCQRSERTRFDYRSGEGVESARHVEPFRLVSLGQRWYLVARDVDRAAWRTFRVDRVTRVRPTGARVVHRDPPDAAALVAEGVAVRAYEHVGVVRLHLPFDEAVQVVPPTVGLVRADPDDAGSSIVEMGGDLDWVARYLAGLRASFVVLEPPALRDELRLVAERLLERCG